MKIYATVAGLKLLEDVYDTEKKDWKLVGRKARVFLKKRSLDFDELEALIEVS